MKNQYPTDKFRMNPYQSHFENVCRHNGRVEPDCEQAILQGQRGRGMTKTLKVSACFLACILSRSVPAYCSEPTAAEDSKTQRATDASPRTARSPSAETTRHALLIGCTTYDRRPDIRPLVGPANDVQLMHDLLERHFSFPEQNIVVLSEKRGGDHRPVRAAIEREFKALAQRAQKGDQVVILMSGHGSQQPDDGDPAKSDELDGLDEIFLPADIGPREETTKFVPNAIIDDELGTWVSAIASKGAHVFIVIDACHSGTMLRGDVEDLARGSARAIGFRRVARSGACTRGQQQQRSRQTVREETMIDRRKAPRDSSPSTQPRPTRRPRNDRCHWATRMPSRTACSHSRCASCLRRASKVRRR